MPKSKKADYVELVNKKEIKEGKTNVLIFQFKDTMGQTIEISNNSQLLFKLLINQVNILEKKIPIINNCGIVYLYIDELYSIDSEIDVQFEILTHEEKRTIPTDDVQHIKIKTQSYIKKFIKEICLEINDINGVVEQHIIDLKTLTYPDLNRKIDCILEEMEKIKSETILAKEYALEAKGKSTDLISNSKETLKKSLIMHEEMFKLKKSIENYEQSYQVKEQRDGRSFYALEEDSKSRKNDIDAIRDDLVRREINIGEAPFNCPNDGSIEVTHIINEAIDYASSQGYSRVRIPSGLYLVDGSSNNVLYEGQGGAIRIPSNIHLTLDSNTIIKQIPTEHPNYNIIYFSKAENSSIRGGVIQGDRLEHLGLDGEFGFGIGIYSSKNIIIENIICKDCWGDGILLNQDWKTRYNDTIPYYDKQNYNINIKNVICDNNRRQGCSIESLIVGSIENSVFRNTNGTAPECGIDIEPFNPIKAVEDITFKNNLFENNNSFGLLLLNTTVKRISIEGNIFKNNKSSEGQLGAKNVSKIVVSNNIFDATKSGGGTKFTSSSEVIVSNNKYIDCWHGFLGSKICEFKGNQVTFDAKTAYNYIVLSEQAGVNCSNINISNNTLKSINDICKSNAINAQGTHIIINNNYIGQAYGAIEVFGNNSYIEFNNNFVIDMAIRGLNVSEGSVKIENNTFSGICFLNNNQSIIHVRNKTLAYLQGNSFYKSRIGGGDKGTGRPSSYIRIEPLGFVESYNNFLDKLTTVNLSKDSTLSVRFPYTIGKTNERPSYHLPGRIHFDTTLNKPIWSTGSSWIDSEGKKL